MAKSKTSISKKTQALQFSKSRNKKKHYRNERYMQLSPMMPSGFTASERARLRALEKKIMEQ